jgi:hypothetical protein
MGVKGPKWVPLGPVEPLLLQQRMAPVLQARGDSCGVTQSWHAAGAVRAVGPPASVGHEATTSGKSGIGMYCSSCPRGI